jgi:transcriptional regulator with XRE-family HTH domain
MNSFSERFQLVISRKKISQAELVAQTGINKSMISLWVNGKITPGAKNMRILSDFFNCSYEWLSKGRGEPFPPTEPKPAESVSHFQPYKAAKDADATLAKLMREKFKQQCGTTYFDEFFDFIAENYGETKEGVDQFFADLHKTHPNYRTWLEEKKQSRENLQLGGPESVSVTSK